MQKTLAFQGGSMNKRVVTIFFLIICFCLLSCASEKQQQKEDDAFRQESFHQLSFQVPVSWETKVDGDGYVEYAETKKGKLKNSLIFSVAENTELDEEFARIRKNAESSSDQGGEAAKIEQKKISVSNMAAIEVEHMNASDSGRDYGRIILIQKEEDVITVLFYSISQDAVSYTHLADRLNTLLGIKTKKEVKEYFYNMQEGHNDLLEELEITYEDVQEDMELFFEKGMIKKKTTCITPVTIGGPFDILYFPSTALKEEFGKLNSIFDTITVCGIDFDDYIFYKKDLSNENAVVGLCGHEKEGFLELTEQKFQELKALELPYYVSCTSEI